MTLELCDYLAERSFETIDTQISPELVGIQVTYQFVLMVQ
jgi:hypothetical protein